MADGPERDMFGFRLPERSTMAIVRRVEGMGDDPLPIGALLGPVLICLAVGAPIGAVIAALTHGDPTIAFIWPMMPFASAHVSGVRHRWLALVVAGIAGLSAGKRRRRTRRRPPRPSVG